MLITVNERKKPTVVLLRDHLLNASAETTTSIGNAGHNEAVPALRSTEQTPSASDSRWQRTQELDEVMSNNFEWLLKFDLRSVNLFDIDESTSGHKRLGRCIRKSSRRSGVKSYQWMKSKLRETTKKNVHCTYTQMIAQCLNELGESSVKRIYNWIQERFSPHKSLDANWKNAIRHTLSTSNLFHKRKVNSRKPYVWYLSDLDMKSKRTEISSQSICDDEIKAINPKEKQKEWISENLPNQNFIIEEPEVQSTISENEIAISDNAQITVLQEIWLPMNSGSHMETNSDSKLYNSDYYELQPAKLESELLMETAAYEEPLEITFLLNEASLLEI